MKFDVWPGPMELLSYVDVNTKQLSSFENNQRPRLLINDGCYVELSVSFRNAGCSILD